jgi:mxaJ protein
MTRGPTSVAGLVALLAALLLPGSAAGGEGKELKVCGDPNNMPFSNEKRQGLENKIAEVIAKDLGMRVVYTWWPHQRGLVKRVLNTGRCDVLIGIPKGYDLVLWTKPYYRTGYVIAYRKDRIAPVRSLDDPALRRLKIGVLINTPPHDALGQRGLTGDNIVGYQLMFDSKFHPEDYPGKAVEDLIAGKIDVALVYGPIAGYFQKKKKAPFLELVPLEDRREGGIRYSFEISMGVRKADKELKARLEEALARRQAEIRKVLEGYGVPLLPLEPAAPAGQAEPTEKGDRR